MAKKLVRGNNVPQNAESLRTSEVMSVALDQISSTAQSVKGSDTSEPILNAMSDILDLMCTYLIASNIDPATLFEHAVEIRKTQGSFDKKVAVPKD